MRAGRVEALGDQGSAAKWAHAALAIAVRALGPGDDRPPDPATVLRIAERVMVEGEARGGADGQGHDLGPADARALLRAWLEAVGLEGGELLAQMQATGFSHSALERRARRCHERRLAAAAHTLDPAGVLEACVAAVPYAPAAAVRDRSWEASLGRLAAGWRRALEVSTESKAVAAAP